MRRSSDNIKLAFGFRAICLHYCIIFQLFGQIQCNCIVVGNIASKTAKSWPIVFVLSECRSGASGKRGSEIN